MKKYALLATTFCTIFLLADAPSPVFKQGEMLDASHPYAFNTPAAIAVSHKVSQMGMENISFFLDASFTYWYLSDRIF